MGKYSVNVFCEDNGEPPRLQMVVDPNGLFTMEDASELKEYLHHWWVNATGCTGALDYVLSQYNSKIRQ